MAKKILYIMCGPAGGGKSTWVREHAINDGCAVVSRDAVRFSMVKENEPYFSQETNVYKTVVISPKESMPSLLSLGYFLTRDIKIDFTSDENFLSWNSFLERGKSYKKDLTVHRTGEDDAIYLHSGGTTGTPKNIVLKNL